MSDPTATTIENEISRELMRVQKDSYGETGCKVEVSLNATFVAVVMDLHLSLVEEALLDSGNNASVKTSRDAFQLAMTTTFTAIVERATGRRVTSFASHAVLDDGPPWTGAIFRLGAVPVGA